MKNQQLAATMQTIMGTFMLVGLVFLITGIVGYFAARALGRSRHQRQGVFLAVSIVGVAVACAVILLRR